MKSGKSHPLDEASSQDMVGRLFGNPWEVSLPSSLSDPLLKRLVAGGRPSAKYDSLGPNLMVYLLFKKYHLKGPELSFGSTEIGDAHAAFDKLAKVELASRRAEKRFLATIDELFAPLVAKSIHAHSESEK